MDEKVKVPIPKDIKDAVCRAFDKLLKSLQETPDLIIEGSEEDVAEETIDDIRQWLFSKGGENGHPDSVTDKQ